MPVKMTAMAFLALNLGGIKERSVFLMMYIKILQGCAF